MAVLAQTIFTNSLRQTIPIYVPSADAQGISPPAPRGSATKSPATSLPASWSHMAKVWAAFITCLLPWPCSLSSSPPSWVGRIWGRKQHRRSRKFDCVWDNYAGDREGKKKKTRCMHAVEPELCDSRSYLYAGVVPVLVHGSRTCRWQSPSIPTGFFTCLEEEPIPFHPQSIHLSTRNCGVRQWSGSLNPTSALPSVPSFISTFAN